MQNHSIGKLPRGKQNVLSGQRSSLKLLLEAEVCSCHGHDRHLSRKLSGAHAEDKDCLDALSVVRVCACPRPPAAVLVFVW